MLVKRGKKSIGAQCHTAVPHRQMCTNECTYISVISLSSLVKIGNAVFVISFINVKNVINQAFVSERSVYRRTFSGNTLWSIGLNVTDWGYHMCTCTLEENMLQQHSVKGFATRHCKMRNSILLRHRDCLVVSPLWLSRPCRNQHVSFGFNFMMETSQQLFITREGLLNVTRKGVIMKEKIL